MNTPLLTVFFLAMASMLFAEGNLTEQQKQIPDNKGIITIDVPAQKKNVAVAPEKITPPGKNETIIKIQPSDQNTITQTRANENEPTFPLRPKLNYEGKYYIPLEGSTEWILEEVKTKSEGILWENGWDDLFINRPGDSWNDYSKMFNFQFATTVSVLTFLSFNSKDNLALEAHCKSFLVTALLMTALELIDSSSTKQHFCLKDYTGGLAGALAGSFVLTIGFGF